MKTYSLVDLTQKELDAIFAALRMLQESVENGLDPASHAFNQSDVYTNSGEHEGLTREELDELCDNKMSDSRHVQPVGAYR